MDLNQTIEHIDEAKTFYWRMGCSHFHMAREYPERYAEYKALAIRSETEAAWRQELADQMYTQIMYTKIMKQRKQDNGLSVSSYLDTIEMTPDNMKKSYKLIKSSYPYMSPLYTVVIAEQITNTGCVYPPSILVAAKKQGQNALFQKYVKLVQKMLRYACKKDRSLLERAKNVLASRTDVSEMLSSIQDRIEEEQPHEG